MEKPLLIILIFIFMCICIDGQAYEKRIALLVRKDFRGEYSLAHRIKRACLNINWGADIILMQNSKRLLKKEYDFVINLVPGTFQFPKCRNYLAIFDPIHHYFNVHGRLMRQYRNYDGYLLAYSNLSSESKRDFSNKKKLLYLNWLPTVQGRGFQVVNPSCIFHICCLWGDRFLDGKFKEVMSFLDKTSYTKFYGSSQIKEMCPQNYCGEIPYDTDDLFETAAAAGIALVFHSSTHNACGIPSGRIFEAAAASTVILCDQNSFVRTNFGDSVLYINTDLDGASICNQIQEHMEWIGSHRDLALEKAKKAHQIYEEKFLLEKQLLQLGIFHDRLSKK